MLIGSVATSLCSAGGFCAGSSVVVKHQVSLTRTQITRFRSPVTSVSTELLSFSPPPCRRVSPSLPLKPSQSFVIHPRFWVPYKRTSEPSGQSLTDSIASPFPPITPAPSSTSKFVRPLLHLSSLPPSLPLPRNLPTPRRPSPGTPSRLTSTLRSGYCRRLWMTSSVRVF